MSIVFLGTPQFAVPSLQRLAADGHTISAVVTQPDRPAGRGRQLRGSPLKLAAEQLGIPVQQPATLRSADAIVGIAALKPQVLITVAYGQILRQEVLDIAPFGVLNVHPSLLPRWRGASPIAAAVLAGDAETGSSIILMDAGMDSGPILAQECVVIQPSDNTATLTEELAHLSADLLARTLPRWLNGDIQPQPQDHSQATTCPRLRREDGLIDWAKPAAEIWRQVRAYNPWPGAYTTLDGQMMHIWEAWPFDHASLPKYVARRYRDAEPGTLLAIPAEHREMLPPQLPIRGIAVQAGAGALALLEMQRSGGRRITSAAFLRGMPNIMGKMLGAP